MNSLNLWAKNTAVSESYSRCSCYLTGIIYLICVIYGGFALKNVAFHETLYLDTTIEDIDVLQDIELADVQTFEIGFQIGGTDTLTLNKATDFGNNFGICSPEFHSALSNHGKNHEFSDYWICTIYKVKTISQDFSMGAIDVPSGKNLNIQYIAYTTVNINVNDVENPTIDSFRVLRMPITFYYSSSSLSSNINLFLKRSFYEISSHKNVFNQAVSDLVLVMNIEYSFFTIIPDNKSNMFFIILDSDNKITKYTRKYDTIFNFFAVVSGLFNALKFLPNKFFEWKEEGK